MEKIYLSKSNVVSIDDITAVVKVLEQNENIVIQYIGGLYDKNLLPSAESVVAITPSPIEEKFLVGRGQHSEIELALNILKPIFLYYNKCFYPIIGIKEYDTKNWKTQFGIIEISDETIPNFIEMQ